MTDDVPPSGSPADDRPRPATRGPRLGRTARALVIVLALVLLLAAALYLNRRAAARELLVGWLDRRGIDADVEVERLELSGFVGRIVIGDARDPDFRVERVEVDYAVGLPWSAAGLGVTPSRIRLVRPVAKLSWKRGRLSMGELDPLIEEFLARPPRPETPGPLVLVEGGQARIDTEYGPVRVLADARLEDGKLMRLSGRMPVASLKSGSVEARGLGGIIEATTVGDRTAVKLRAEAERLVLAGADGRGLGLSLSGDLPYPDLKTRRGDGRVGLSAQLTADELAGGGAAAQAVDATLEFAGAVEGWLNAWRLDGQARGAARADRLRGEALDIRKAALDLGRGTLSASGETDEAVKWRAASPARLSLASGRLGEARLTQAVVASTGVEFGGQGGAFEAQGPATLAARRLATGDLTLNGARGRLDFDLVRDGVTRLSAAGALGAAQASAPLFGAPRADDVPELAELKRALGAFALDAPRVRLVSDNAGVELDLLRPIRARPVNGGELRLSAATGPALALAAGEAAHGAFSLDSTRGAGLPEARFDGVRWRLARGGFTARLKGQAALDFGPARDIAFSTEGELASVGGRLTYTTNRCGPVTVRRLDLGENAVEALSGRVCPTRDALISAQGGVWRARGRLADVAASAPFLGMRFTEAQGDLAVDGAPGGTSMRAGIDRALVSDATDPARFLPLQAKGEARLAGDVWTAGLDLSRLDYAVGRVDLRHDGRAGAGGAAISVPGLTFTAHGLQPGDLSPMIADYVKSPVEGSAAFEGRFDWAAQGATSGGVLTVPDLDFASPAGKVEGLKGRVEFTSLTPLVTAPDQRLTADRVQTVTPLTDLELRFGLDQGALHLQGGQVAAAGGRLRVEPLDLPLTPGQAWGGVVVVEGIQLNELIKSANLQDKAELDAVVSGRLPFTYDPKAGWRISGGVLNGVRPGRLSIQPEVFDDLAAGGGEGAAALPPNTMQDLAYQAMQDLAISDLTAEVNSLDGGRLGVRFHIRGRHDPPEREQLRLTFMELLRRDFMNKKLNLPSDTPIDLTLDTTWNVNQIVSDLLEYARRGEEPQPEP